MLIKLVKTLPHFDLQPMKSKLWKVKRLKQSKTPPPPKKPKETNTNEKGEMKKKQA